MFFSPTALLNSTRKNPLIQGTLLLTCAGFISRLMGFGYRIYLSRCFSAEKIGIYQLITPIMALSYSLAVSGFQTAISKLTAMHEADNPHAMKAEQFLILCLGTSLSFLCSAVLAILVYRFADFLSLSFLQDSRTAPLLRLLALSFPMSAIHACLNGYFYGRKSASFPAASQLLEQLLRISTVCILYRYALSLGKEPSIAIAVIGILIEETASAVVSILYLRYQSRHVTTISGTLSKALRSLLPAMLKLAVPLSANHVVLNLLQSMEAVAIPVRLQYFGLSAAEALGIYGTLTGMALPFILFPTAVTNSMAVMLLPVISQAQAMNQMSSLRKTARKCLGTCLALGCCCTIFFLLFGRLIGRFFYNSSLAGNFIMVLGFLCPFLYSNAQLSSILHGLGLTSRSLVIHASALFLRLLFVYLGIPRFGMGCYLVGLLCSQIFLFFLQFITLKREIGS